MAAHKDLLWSELEHLKDLTEEVDVTGCLC